MTPERDGVSGMAAAVALAPAVYSADQNGAIVDVRNWRKATLLLNIGVGGITFTGTNRVDFVLMAGNASDGSDLANVTADDIINPDTLTGVPATITNGIVRSLAAAHAAATVQKIAYIGGKAYLRLTADFGGTHATGTPMAAVVVEEDGEIQRVA